MYCDCTTPTSAFIHDSILYSKMYLSFQFCNDVCQTEQQVLFSKMTPFEHLGLVVLEPHRVKLFRIHKVFIVWLLTLKIVNQCLNKLLLIAKKFHAIVISTLNIRLTQIWDYWASTSKQLLNGWKSKESQSSLNLLGSN